MCGRWSGSYPLWASSTEQRLAAHHGVVSSEGFFSRHLLVAVFENKSRAERAISRLIENDYPPDRISLLGKGVASGDDILGIHDPAAADRMKSWGRQGALWGGLWGLIGGAAGTFAIPGLGTLFVIGWILDGVAAAAAGAGTMALAALLSEVLVRLHRFGVPEAELHGLEQAIREGSYVMILQGDEAELMPQRRWLQWAGAISLHDFPERSDGK